MFRGGLSGSGCDQLSGGPAGLAVDLSTARGNVVPVCVPLTLLFAFWKIVIATLLVGSAVDALNAHLVAWSAERGITQTAAAFALSAFYLANPVGHRGGRGRRSCERTQAWGGAGCSAARRCLIKVQKVRPDSPSLTVKVPAFAN